MGQIQYTERQFKTLEKIRKSTIDVCKKCEGVRFVKGKICDCYAVFEWCAALVGANIPPTYWGLDIEELDKIPKVVRNIVIKYMNNFDVAYDKGLGFIFSGEWGIGKTALLCEIGKHALLQGKKIFYCLTDDYVRSVIKPEVLNTKTSIEEFDMILLDEMDKIYIKAGSDYAVKETEKLLRNFLPFHKPILIATNATDEQIKDAFGPSTLSIIKRHLKIVSYEGIDQADDLQDKWMERLEETNTNYMTGNILKYGRVYGKRYVEED